MEQLEYANRILALFSAQSLWIALQAVVENPQQELRVSTPFVSTGQAHSLDSAMLAASAAEPGALAHTDRMAHFKDRNVKWRFLNVYDRRIVRFDDTVANRFVAFFVRYSIKMLKPIAASLSQLDEGADLVPEFLRIIRRLNGLWSQFPDSFKYSQLREMPIDHPFLQFDPRYHVILKTYLACENG